MKFTRKQLLRTLTRPGTIIRMGIYADGAKELTFVEAPKEEDRYAVLSKEEIDALPDKVLYEIWKKGKAPVDIVESVPHS